MSIPPPNNLPYWAWLIGLMIVTLGTLGGVYLTQRRTRSDMAEIKHQVKNSHETNLREDVDAIAASQESMSQRHIRTDEAVHRVERAFADLDRSIRAIEHSMDRRDKLHETAVTEIRGDFAKHLDDVPRILDEAFRLHDEAHHPHGH